jgi:hypothetical protein
MSRNSRNELEIVLRTGPCLRVEGLGTCILGEECSLRFDFRSCRSGSGLPGLRSVSKSTLLDITGTDQCRCSHYLPHCWI